ncbi:MAG: phosphoribosylformylglycinamidine synthase, partial [Eggerthellaceae bacterium]|nr:phosphoribosylformylglycinamidine synthase [Eggerthellaceae bacterium]
ADGLSINLDAVPKKYEGLDGTELAIAESQERMAVALAPEDVDAFIALAHEENLEATPIAVVTEEPRVRMNWNGDVIVDVSRAFLASNGAPKAQDVRVEEGGTWTSPAAWGAPGDGLGARLEAVLTDLNVASNKGLAERFDSTIGAATVLMPFGGARQLTPSMAMVAKMPVDGETTTCSGLAWGFNPYLSAANQYDGAYLAVVESVAKLVAAGFRREDAYLTLQEYFEKLRDEPARWGKPVASVLGALMAQVDLGVGAIGGKDSMSGSFEALDVPPTLVSFATAVGPVARVTSPEFKGAGHRVCWIVPAAADVDSEGDAGVDSARPAGVDAARAAAGGAQLPNPASLRAALDAVEALIGAGDALAVSTPGYGAGAEALFKMAVGNGIGLTLDPAFDADTLFTPAYGSFLVELADGADLPAPGAGTHVEVIGETTADYTLTWRDEVVPLAPAQEAWEARMEPVFPYRSTPEAVAEAGEVPQISWRGGVGATWHGPAADASGGVGAPGIIGGEAGRPRVVIPVFPGNNCEFDSARAFERAGARATTLIVNNLTPAAVAESTEALVRAIGESQIIMIPGGFSGGDEPDGSAKFITAFFRAPAVTEAVRDLLQRRDGLMLGICNGFQALVKLGLVPFGDIRPMDADCPTLTFNAIGRHQSRLVNTRIASNLSPWLSACEVGDIHTIAISHGEGRFVAPPALLDELVANGQVATQYVDAAGVPSMDLAVNPNGSMLAIEGITSPDGRVLGKMGHTERIGDGVYKNVPGNTFQPLFEGGVNYFKI